MADVVDQAVAATHDQRADAQVQIQPLPENWTVGQFVGPDGHVWTSVQIQGPWGVMIHALPAAAARKIGTDIQRAGSHRDLLIAGG